jgi:ATP-dependent Clp protease, protease subunit
MKTILVLILTCLISTPALSKTITLTNKNTVSLSGPIEGRLVAKVFSENQDLDTENENKDPIYLFLNTPGGSIQAGFELIDNTKQINRPVHTITKFSASMGFQIVQNLGDRYILGNGVMMSHEAHGGFEGSFSHGKSQLDSIYNFWLKRIEELDLVTVSRTKGKQTLDSYRKAYSKDLWLTARQAVSQGYSDSIVGVKCAPSLRGTRVEIENLFIGRVAIKFSLCPLITAPISVEPVIDTNKGPMALSSFRRQKGSFGLKEGQDKLPELFTFSTQEQILELSKKAKEFEENKIKELNSRIPIRN